MIRKFFMAFALIGSSVAISACNTVKGAGEDIQSVGECGEDVLDGQNC